VSNRTRTILKSSLVAMLLVSFFTYLSVTTWGVGKLSKQIDSEFNRLDCITDCRIKKKKDCKKSCFKK
jgi:hypothetical protein